MILLLSHSPSVRSVAGNEGGSPNPLTILKKGEKYGEQKKKYYALNSPHS
jgi:hypothetical protein